MAFSFDFREQLRQEWERAQGVLIQQLDRLYAQLASLFAPPSAPVGLTAVPGTASSAMRSDAAPRLDVGIAPTWTGGHTWKAFVRLRQAPDNTVGSKSGLEAWNTSNIIGLLRWDASSGLFELQIGTTTRLAVDNSGNVAFSGTPPTGIGRFALPGGTVETTGDWALTSGWGANATISAVAGNDARGAVRVTTSALDRPGANPVITLTCKDGTWTNTPYPTACMNDEGTGPLAAVAARSTATTLVLTYVGTPTAVLSRTYIFTYHVLG